MKKYCFLFLILFIAFTPVFANGLADSDWDGVPDKDETEIYKTDPEVADTDGDGYND